MDKLRILLEYVCEHNGFYQKRIRDYGITHPLEIDEWPVLTRADLQEYREQLFSNGYLGKHRAGGLRRQSSSGSTGEPVTVYWDERDWYASNLSLWRKRASIYRIFPNDRRMVFTMNLFGIQPKRGKLYFKRKSENELWINTTCLDLSGYPELLRLIEDFQPVWLYIQPYVLELLADQCEKAGHGLPESLRYIESVGEYLPDSLRDRCRRLFGLELTNLYGSEEMNGIAYESPDGTMPVLTDNVLVEIRQGNSLRRTGEGEAVITNLNNRAMPLIRYVQGDIITLGNHCSPNGKDTVIETIRGRILSGQDFRYSRPLLNELIAECNNIYGGIIRRYEFQRNAENAGVNCFLTLRKNQDKWFDSVSATLRALMESKTDPNGTYPFQIIQGGDCSESSR